MPVYEFTDQPDSLGDTLASELRLAVDTEFMREKTYFAELCLIQIAAGERIFCVDPLAGKPMQAFWASLAEREWVVHSARQDIEVICQTAGIMPARLFDTQVAASLLGMPAQIGYANLIKTCFGVNMAKSHTRADWTRRPLPESYLQYAAEDVEYLLAAADQLSEQLDQRGRLEWAVQDSMLLLDPALYDMQPQQAVSRLKGARNLRGRQRAAATRLAVWREQEAIKRNRPRQWILRDKCLLEIANRLPESMPELGSVAGMPTGLLRRAGDTLLKEIALSAGDTSDYLPPPRPDEAQKTLLKEMQAKVAACAADLDIAAETLASRRELSSIIISGSRDSRVFRDWRAALIGDELAALL